MDEIDARWLLVAVGVIAAIVATGRIATWIVLTRKRDGGDTQ